MGFTYLAHGTDPLLRQIAGEIITYQASEIGVMGEHLTQWGQVGTEADTAMGWMGMAAAQSVLYGRWRGFAASRLGTMTLRRK